ncbi:hypothetical protein P43SY_004160 [Pythium insidiosum]|uniref:Croquemort-like mating protein M82 n=1 Tax=Pythium insidiosum TaxID=114742 RepID=A0AAD5M4S6_PYTIN|nr:hypothetical protein P43SY_004160 [Pythium insidiosum]
MPDSFLEHHEKNATTPAQKYDSAEGARPRRCSPVVIGNTCIVVGALIMILAVVFGTVVPPVVTKTINDGVVVCSAKDVAKTAFTDAYGDCHDCTPFYFSLSMFNITNAREYLETGAKLRVQEVGPYAYRRREIRVDVAIAADGDSVSYKMYRYHTFDPAKSCAGCSDSDVITSWDVGYLNVISQAGGEVGFLRQLIKGTLWGLPLSPAEIDAVIKTNGTQIMRWVNGLNSNRPSAWKVVGSTVQPFLLTGLSAISSLDLSGFEYNGLFLQLPISDWAIGYPSLLAGLSLGSNYVFQCRGPGKLDEQCGTCLENDSCDASIWAGCKLCKLGKDVVQSANKVACGRIEKIYANAYGADEAKAFVAATCSGNCESLGLCAAPLPGAVEDSGFDYSQQPPPSEALATFVQRTGCHNKDEIAEYVQFHGLKTQPYWVELDSRRAPTLAEINGFAVYGNCARPTANMTCSDVIGNDGTSTRPGGATINGFPDSVATERILMYLEQAKQNITLVNSGEVVDDIDGIRLTRFSPPNDLLTMDNVKRKKGTGYPVDGVQPLAFNVGFLAYLSYPVFLFGDNSLLDGVEITMFDGQIATPSTLYETNGQLKRPYFDRYQTVVDIEPGTGKTMRARKRLQASYALAESTFSPGKPMSDVVWPTLASNVISPAYIGEESAVIKPSAVSDFKMIVGLLTSLLPVLIAGAIVGVAAVGGGLVYRRRALTAAAAALETF